MQHPHPDLEQELKALILREAQKEDDTDPAAFTDDAPLFGSQSPVGLDSLDALQISIALQQHYGVRLSGARMVRKNMASVRDLADYIRSQS